MTLPIAVIISIGINLVLIGIAWGNLKNSVDELRRNRGDCMKRFAQIEDGHNSAIKDIREEIQCITRVLYELVGKIDLFLKMNSGEKKNGH